MLKMCYFKHTFLLKKYAYFLNKNSYIINISCLLYKKSLRKHIKSHDLICFLSAVILLL